ncbi:MAG: TonB-dependent receptor [Acidobacteria bacterium]|nr:MAG: TonB-dependent receptor [Acidobacteriota bacterium]
MLSSRLTVTRGLCALAVVLAAGVAAAQTNTGQISGTIRDSSGGVLPGVTVTVTNVNTGIARTEVTGPDGTYTITSLPVGSYSVAAELPGFRKAEKTGFDLPADGRITADFALGVGALTETVQVQAVRGEVVNHTSGEIARVIDGAQVRELALSGRNYLELASLIPGAIQIDDDQMALTTSLGTGGTIINGSRGNTNSLMVDGGFNLDSGSNSSQINNVGLDFIDQVNIQTSNFSAEYGRNSGAAINVVTKSGTNRYRGSAVDTIRNQRFDATNYFAPRDANGSRIKGKLDFKDYTGSFGGPIQRNRLFFFGGVEYKKLNRVDGPFRRTMPTLAELNGDFSARSGVINDPLTGQPFLGNVIPDNRITADGRAIANVYRAMIARALQFSNTPTSNNATYQLDFPYKSREDILRFDYKASNQHRVYLRYIHDMYDLVEPRGTFITADLPTISTNRKRPGFSYQLGHSWIVRPSLINDAKVNASWNGQRIPPFGDAWRRDTYGFAFPQVFDKGRYDEGIPDVTLSNFSNSTLTGPSQSLLSPTTDITAMDTLTWLKARHSVRFGAIVTRNRKDQNGRLAHTGNVNFNPSGNTNTTGNALADALLGNFRTYSEGGDDPLGFFRFTQFGAYASDTWRVRSRLSVEVGLRYELASPTYTMQNNIVNFDPALYDPKAAAVLNPNGSIANPGTNRYTGLIRADSGVPSAFQDRVTIDAKAGALIPIGAARGLYDTHQLLMPRFSAAYSVNDSTVVRGGVGVFYDKPEGNVIFSQVNLPPFVPSISVENGNLANPLGGRTAADAVLGTVNAIQPDMNVPRQINFSVSVQRELPGGHLGEVAYVGNRGRHQLWFPEINQPAFEDLVANAALPTAQRANTNYLRPYKGYSSIRQRRSDAFSNYNSLQLYLSRRKGDIRYTASYTLSKAIGNASGIGDNPEDAFNKEFNTGPLSFDRRHALITTFTYSPPLWRERQDILGEAFGGWELSGKTRWQSGQYLTVTGNTSTGTRRADYLGGDIDLADRGPNRWFNTDVFATAPDTRRGNATVGQIQGPHFYRWDLSLRKNFGLPADSTLQVRVDAFNAFNRVNFNNPNTTVTSSAFGTISTAKTPREFQFSLRLQF